MTRWTTTICVGLYLFIQLVRAEQIQSEIHNFHDDSTDSQAKRASWLDMKRDFDSKRASWLDMKRDYDPKRASWLDMKRDNEPKRASWLDMKRASWLDMKRNAYENEVAKRASWLDMKRASWLDMKRDMEKRASWLDMKRSVEDKDEYRREVALLRDELDRLYARAVEKGKLDNEGLKLLREMLLRKELISPSALSKIKAKLNEVKAYRQEHNQ